jgi:hypothetical protein
MSPTETLRSTLLSPDDLHRRMAASIPGRLQPNIGVDDWERVVDDEWAARRLEHAYVEEARRQVTVQARLAPKDAALFVAWFESLQETGPGQGDPLFPWLAERANRQQMCWFLAQEMTGEAGFDDLVAMTQVKLPTRAKLELARNYWDEMGQGNASGMHGPMLDGLGHALQLVPTEVVWESMALGNLMVALATNRHYAYQAIGALGVIELTAPGRCEFVNAGLKRLGISGQARRYYALHATLDRRHSASWNEEVLGPLVAADARVAVCIAEGALMRLQAGRRCFERYRSVLMPGPAPA